MKKVTEEWLKAARDDLDVIGRIVSAGHLSHMVAFHAQQCVEKAFKQSVKSMGSRPVRRITWCTFTAA